MTADLLLHPSMVGAWAAWCVEHDKPFRVYVRGHELISECPEMVAGWTLQQICDHIELNALLSLWPTFEP